MPMPLARFAAAIVAAAVLLDWGAAASLAQQDEPQATASSDRANPLDDPSFFPLAVWVQNPSRAPEYKKAGINLYVGLWRGPTEEHLAELKRHGMYVVCAQNAVGRANLDNPTIVAWMHGDEPDNAQARRDGKGWGPPIPPEKVVEDYRRIKEIDASRPVLLNLGQGVAWDNWIGRGVRRNHPEDYPEYVKACDIASFDIYPACHDNPEVAGKLWMVADGVSRLKKWHADKPVWNCIECTHINNPKAKATPQQVKAEVWMSIIRGSRGIIYFVHQFEPRFIEAGLLADPEMVQGVTKTNQQIQELAAVINRPDITDGVVATSSKPDVPIEAIAKRDDAARYVFAVAMRDGETEGTFELPDAAGRARAEVLGENRSIEVVNGKFQDTFRAWDVHLYRITGLK